MLQSEHGKLIQDFARGASPLNAAGAFALAPVAFARAFALAFSFAFAFLGRCGWLWRFLGRCGWLWRFSSRSESDGGQP